MRRVLDRGLDPTGTWVSGARSPHVRVGMPRKRLTEEQMPLVFRQNGDRSSRPGARVRLGKAASH